MPECLSAVGNSALGSNFASDLFRALPGRLSSLRSKYADPKAEQAHELINDYGKIIKDVLEVQLAVANAPTGHGIGKALVSMIIIEIAKEDCRQLDAQLIRISGGKAQTGNDEASLLLELRTKMLENINSPAVSLPNKGMAVLESLRKSEGIKGLSRLRSAGEAKTDVSAIRSSLSGISDGIASSMRMSADSAISRVDGIRKSALMLLVPMTAFAILIVGTLCMSVRIARSISRPIVMMSEVSKAIAAGDTGVGISFTSNDEVGELADAFKRMIQSQKERADIIQAISKGDLSVNINLLSDKDTVGKSLMELSSSIKYLLEQIRLFSNTMRKGRLHDKLDSSVFSGDYRILADRINDLVATIVSFLDEIPSPVMGIDTERNVIYANRSCLEVMGKPIQEVSGKKCYSLFKTGDCEKGCAVSKCMKERRNITMETDAHPQGMNLDIKYTGIPLYDESGAVGGALELVIDLTEIKRAQRVVEKQAAFQDNEARKLSEVLRQLSEGDMTIKYDVEAADDDTRGTREKFISIANAVNATAARLEEALSAVLTACDQVNSGSDQIADASQSLSQGATEQAASLEEISSSMAQIGSQITTNAENAGVASKLSSETKKSAIGGADEMAQMVDAMKNINVSSQQIAKVNKVIDDIAFQTNLLALNAAVEAARAGIHGKGFAVVAGEVRNLAGRSAKAAKETAEIIDESIDKVQKGLTIAEKTSDVFKVIVDDIVKVADLAAEIATASNEQAQGITQINQGLAQIDQVTQQNTAHAEETAAASEELSGQAVQLLQLIRQFKLYEKNQALSGHKNSRRLT